MATSAESFGVSLGMIKEEMVEVESDDDVYEVMEEEEEEEPYMGEGLFSFVDFEDPDGDGDVPDRDPLSDPLSTTDYEYDMFYDVEPMEEEESYEDVDRKMSNVLPMPIADAEKNVTPEITQVPGSMKEVDEVSTEDQHTPLIITSVSSLRGESFAGTNAKCLKAASFRNLDVFRCFLCRTDFNTFDDFLVHRTKTKNHMEIPYDAEAEKAFLCGICQKPWNQPRKALACAVFGHDPSKIYESMFIHACPLCPENHLAFHSLSAVAIHWSHAHRDKPLPAFLLKSIGIDQLPSIKVSLYDISVVSESMIKDKPQLVLENLSSPAPDPSNSGGKQLKVYRCSECKRNFETRREVELHQCPVKHFVVPPPALRQYICDDCGKEFPCGRNFRMHLLRAGNCKKDGTTKRQDYPYKCIFCGNRFNSFKAYMCHRAKVHAKVPYNAALELPFACKICQKPAFVPKEAMICALFGHDPTPLRKAMFKYKCTSFGCMSLGFHSPFALKRHWELDHPNFEIPAGLQNVVVDKPLPTMHITLDQLLSLKKLRDVGSSLVIDREIHPSLAMYVQKSPKPTECSAEEDSLATKVEEQEEIEQTLKFMQPKHSVEVAYLSSNRIDSSDMVRRSLVEESVQKGFCVICKKQFKDIRRHFKTHDDRRFSGVPLHKCVCGKEYHLRNSLHSHWKNNKACKLKYLIEKEEKETTSSVLKCDLDASSSNDFELKIPSPSHSSFEEQNIKVEHPEINAIAIESELDVSGSDLSNFPKMDLDLYAEYAKFDEETESNTIDLSNFIHLEVEEVQDDCDNNAESAIAENISDNLVIEPKKPRVCICTLCNMGFPTQVSFMEHMAKEHTDSLPFPCRHCGKRFKLNDQRKKHETIHDSNRYSGEPTFACDKCDQKYHLKTSLETHRKIKHLGYIRPKAQTDRPIFQHRAIGAGKKKLVREVHECTDCNETFEFKYKLVQHIGLFHSGEMQFKSETREKGFPNASELNVHVKHVHEKIVKGPLPAAVKSVKKELSQKTTVKAKRYSCEICQRNFPKSSLLEQHRMVHTGEKPHVCGECGRGFRLRKSLNAHSLTHDTSKRRDNDNAYKCCVCGRHDFLRPNDLHLHRLKNHKDIPYDRKKERPFGCGVCQKPYFLRRQAMICAILGHDPQHLQEVMFKHKCPECPEERLGYHNFSSIRNHWLVEHPDKTMPGKFLVNSQNTADSLPYIVINKEKAAELRETGPTQRYDFPLVVEFDLLRPENHAKTSPPLPILTRQSESWDNEPSILAEEEYFLSTEITLNEALEAVKALVTSSSRRSKSQSNSQKKRLVSSPRKSKPPKKTEVNLKDSLAEDRVLGSKRIAGVLERIRTARARKAALKESTQNKDDAITGTNNKHTERIKR